MKRHLTLSECETETLIQLSINHPWRDARTRAAGLLMLGAREHPSVIAKKLGVSHQSLYNWRHAWEASGLVGLMGGHTGGRPRSLSAELMTTAVAVARADALTLKPIAQRIEAAHHGPLPWVLETLGDHLRAHGFSFKRTRLSLKKNRDAVSCAASKTTLAGVKELAQQGECRWFYYDEAGFSASPPLQRAWSPVGVPHPVVPAHHQRVSVMGALDFAGQRLYHQQVAGTVHRETFVAFIDDLLTRIPRPLSMPTFIVLDNAKLHHGLDDDITWRWMTQHQVFLCYLPPYSPELNMIEILWQQTKYHWRECLTWTKETLPEKVRELLDGYGSKFQISFT